VSFMTLALAAMLLGNATSPQLPSTVTHRITWRDVASSAAQPSLALYEQAPLSGDTSHPVLYIHGATISSQQTVFYRFAGSSWADSLNGAGFDVFGLDFAGFGGSERYPSMMAPAPTEGRPEGDSSVAVLQIERAVRFILARTKAKRVSIVSHSWGTIAAGRFAALHPELVDRLVLFGAVGQREGKTDPVTRTWDVATADDQYQKFLREVPAGESPKLYAREFADWGKSYLASDPLSGRRHPAAVVVPLGPGADAAAAWSGRFPYAMAGITASVLIVRGAWDRVASAADANWLRGQLVNAERVESVELPQGTHLMHLETGRTRLFAVVNAFLIDPSPVRR
jgi:pimeloyl-ACP methyl ester carboxylesterase